MRNILLACLVLIIAGVVAYFFLQNKSSLRINSDSPAVVKQLQSLNRFETSSFHIEKIIDAGTDYDELRQFLFGDQLLLIAHGQVIAGFDLSKLSDGDVKVEKETATLNLPKPEILITTLNNDQTRVYDRKQGLLTRGDKDLEANARIAAQESIRAAACTEHILDEAAKNGRSQLTALLKSLGFTTVIINIPAASC